MDKPLVATGGPTYRRYQPGGVIETEPERLVRQSLRRRDGDPAYELITSCEPCAMCLGAALWSGVGRIVCGAGRDDAAALGFDEGPVFPSSFEYLQERGVDVTLDVLADEARAVFALYRDRGGLVYNG